jgi:hypothetical protein
MPVEPPPNPTKCGKTKYGGDRNAIRIVHQKVGEHAAAESPGKE